MVFLCVYAHRRIATTVARNLSRHLGAQAPLTTELDSCNVLRGRYKGLQAASRGCLVCSYLMGARAAFQGLPGPGALVVGSEAAKGG